MSICFRCGIEIPPGPNGEEYKWCNTDCKQKFHDENFGEQFLTAKHKEVAELEMERGVDGFKDIIDEVNEGKSLKTNGNGFFEKKDEKHNLDIEPNKPGLLSRLWNKTIFPEKKKAKKEEKALRRELEQEAKMSALKELGPELKNAYKKKELDKLMGKKEGSKFWKKIGEELAATGRNINTGKMLGSGMSLGGSSTGPSTDKLMAALGKAPNVDPTKNLNKGVKQDRISKILKKRKAR